MPLAYDAPALSQAMISLTCCGAVILCNSEHFVNLARIHNVMTPAVFKHPLLCCCWCSIELLVDSAGDVHSLLCIMGVLGALEHFEVGKKPVTQTPLGQHALDGFLKDPLRYSLHSTCHLWTQQVEQSEQTT